MNQVGARILFNGIGGDELFWTDGGGTPELADLLARGQLLTMLTKARKYSQFGGIPIWRLLLTHAVAPLTSARRTFHWQPSEITKRCSWTTQKAKEWFNQSGRRFGLRVDTQVPVPSQRMRVLSVRSFQSIFAAGYFRGIHGIYFSHPYSHQQLVDFVLSLPMEQLVRPGEGRSLMRRATRGLLPEKTRNRRSKSGTDECFCRALAREQHTIGNTKDLLVCQRGYAEPAALAEAIRLASAGRIQYSGGVRRVLSLEKWLRSLEHIASRRAMLRQSAVQASALAGVAD
jgi:asparagine synthase (glutamine-hydrolysing)